MRSCSFPYVLAVLLLVGPGTRAEAQATPRAASATGQFADLARDFVYTTLAFSPASATQAGLHEWTDPTTGGRVLLDSLLDDFSPAAIARQRSYYQRVRGRLAAMPRAALGPETQADYDLLHNGAVFGLFGLTEERFHERHPQLYAENLGGALFANITLEYADRGTRAAHLAARLAQVPTFLAVARRNLTATNDVYTRVALQEADGVTDLVRSLGADFVKSTPSARRYAEAMRPALDALEEFKGFVRDTLPTRGTVDWRAGRERYARKWRYYLQVSRTPAQMLTLAEDSVRATRREMLALARPLHDRWFPEHHHTGDAAVVLNAVVGETLARIGAEHANRDSLLEQITRHVGLLERTVRDRRVLSLDTVPNLRIIPTPEFQRGIYGVAGAVFAPALEPELATFFWVTPIPGEWSPERADAKLREYNDYKTLDLAIHEGIPGHVVQGAYANRVTPDWRRLLRVVLSNTPYVEGWAVYAEHVMMYDAGVNGGDSAKMRLTDLKGMLRIYVNAIIDVRLHTMGMPGDSAVAMMMHDAFQERPEAEAKLQRAQLDYVQLVAYLAGVTDWTSFRAEAQRREGEHFDLCRFHDTVLLYGPLPVPTVRRLYFAGVPPTASAPASRCRTATATSDARERESAT
jgi:hypothetical protein